MTLAIPACLECHESAGVAGRADQGRGDGRAPPDTGSSSTALPEEQLLRFPADQVILLDQKREYDVRFDDLMKTMKLPAWQARGAGRPGHAVRRAVAVRRRPGRAVHLQRSSEALAAGPADRAAAARRSPAAPRRRARRHATQESVRGLRAAARRPVDRQAVPLRTRRRYGPPPRPASRRRGKERRLQPPLRGDPPEVK